MTTTQQPNLFAAARAQRRREIEAELAALDAVEALAAKRRDLARAIADAPDAATARTQLVLLATTIDAEEAAERDAEFDRLHDAMKRRIAEDGGVWPDDPEPAVETPPTPPPKKPRRPRQPKPAETVEPLVPAAADVPPAEGEVAVEPTLFGPELTPTAHSGGM